jgi:hypothetical protein
MVYRPVDLLPERAGGSVVDLLPFLGTLGLGALGGAVTGAIITQVMTNARDRRSQRVAYVKQQLEQFYGPLLAAHKEIRARSELRVKLQQAIDAQHAEAMLEAAGRGEVIARTGRIGSAPDAQVPTIVTNIQDESQTFREVLMPRYRSMIDIFRDKMTLAEPETRKYFERLVEFVDVWDKILANQLPRSIAPAIDHTEANLKPFYEHLEEVHDRLRREVSQGEGTDGTCKR